MPVKRASWLKDSTEATHSCNIEQYFNSWAGWQPASGSMVGGLIAGNGLTEWWIETFSSNEREFICERHRVATFPEPEHDTIANGPPVKAIGNLAAFVSGWTGRCKAQERTIDYRLITKAEELIDSSTDIAARHFLFMRKAEIYYRWRDLDEFALDRAIDGCRQQIAISKEAARALRIDDDMPSHHGFKQLAIIEEKRGNYAQAIRLCEQAKSDGWWGDWDKRTERLRKKLVKHTETD